MSSNKSKQFLQGKECFSRMNFLYQASMLMAGKSNTLSAYYGELCKNIGKKAVLRIDPAVKRNLCKRCSLALQPGATADLTVEPQVKRRRRRKRTQKMQNIDEQARILLTCRQCSYQRNFVVNSDYEFWLENPESIVETIELTTQEKKKVVACNNAQKEKNNKNEIKAINTSKNNETEQPIEQNQL